MTFDYMDKEAFSSLSNILFDILADNMQVIAPTGNTREEDYKCWYEGVGDGLKRAERQIVLIKDADSIVGFFQYYTNEDTFMMEEIQLKPEYQGKGVLRELYGFILNNIENDLEYIEAYANVNNQKSIGILVKFGLSNTGINKNGNSYHFKGNFVDLIKWYESK